METQERMMIVGLCLQGILANPVMALRSPEQNVGTALAYAAELEGKTPDANGESEASKITRICQLAFNAYGTAYEHGQTWDDIDEDTKLEWQQAVVERLDKGWPENTALTENAQLMINAIASVY